MKASRDLSELLNFTCSGASHTMQVSLYTISMHLFYTQAQRYIDANHMDKAKQYHRFSLLCSETSVISAMASLLLVPILLMAG